MLCCSCFRGIVNWLGCFDVVVMREGGWWERLAKAPYNWSPFYFWPMRDLCWRAVKRNETWWNHWEMTQIWRPNAEYSSVGETQAIFFLFSPAEGRMLSQLLICSGKGSLNLVLIGTLAVIELSFILSLLDITSLASLVLQQLIKKKDSSVPQPLCHFICSSDIII